MSKIKIYFSLAILIFSIVIAISHFDTITFYLSILLAMLIGIVTVSSIIGSIIGGLFIFERFRMLRANRIELEKSAHVMVVDANGFTFVRETNHRATWHNLSLEQRVYSNGKPGEPTAIETRAWELVTTSRFLSGKAQKENALALTDGETKMPLVDLMQALDEVQRCLIVGPSNAGKTTVLQHLVNRRQSSSKVIVIDPHAYPEKWNKCEVIGIGRDYAKIDNALSALVQLMTKRYEEIGKGLIAEGTHPKLTIVIDEWRAITQNLGKPASDAIKALLTESRKAAFSVFVTSHSDRAKPLGLEGEYDLKDGFTVIYLSISNGQRQATIDHGNGEIITSLPGPFYTANIHPLIEGEAIALEAEPTEDEQRIIKLYQQGASFNHICSKVYGSKGGRQIEMVKQVLKKYEVSTE